MLWAPSIFNMPSCRTPHPPTSHPPPPFIFIFFCLTTEMTHVLFVVVKRDTCWIIFDPGRHHLIKRVMARPALLSCPGGSRHTRRPASSNDVARADLYANIRWRLCASFCLHACFRTCCLSVTWWVDGTRGDHKCSLKMSAHVATSSLPVPRSLSQSQ